MYTDLTKNQNVILKCLESFTAKNGCPPTVREICRMTGLKSTSTVHAGLQVLAQRGYIRQGAGKKQAFLLATLQAGDADSILSMFREGKIGYEAARESLLGLLDEIKRNKEDKS